MSSCTRNNYATLEPLYEKQNLSELPDYSNLNYWAAHPNKKSTADSVPSILSKTYHPVKSVDVFFVHPTTYLDSNKPFGMNASFKDFKTNITTDYTTILNQASIFNEVGRIYAPRYRQAHINAYSPVDHQDSIIAIAAFELAYQDVKAAFEYYMEHENKGRPIIIASHSQGSTHAKRLLKEFFDDKALGKKLVAAYVVGMAIDPADYVQLKACEQPNATGCICAWRTYQEGYIPDFIKKEKFNSIVTNPISWNTKDTVVTRSFNEGSVLYNFNKITTHVVGAINHKGILWTKKPQFMGNFFYRTKNFHIADYNFYYLSVRKNVAERVNSYLSANNNYTH
jgi:hypothetical protein